LQGFLCKTLQGFAGGMGSDSVSVACPAAPLLRRFDWLIIDEFAFDKIERGETPRAANLLYKITDARSKRSTTVVTNIDFDAKGAYVDNPPLAVAFLDRRRGQRHHHQQYRFSLQKRKASSGIIAAAARFLTSLGKWAARSPLLLRQSPPI
jgi:hypothetical protein